MPAPWPRPPVIASGRDIRLDLFRGLALWFIFVDHIPTNVVSWFTVRNYGFSDATEIFVFISGYTAVIAYARMMQREGWLRAAARIYRRVWQLYVAHILLFVAFTAQIVWVSIARDMPSLIEEMELMGLGQNPYRAILEAALLQVPAGQSRRPAALYRAAGGLPLRPAGGHPLAVGGDCASRSPSMRRHATSTGTCRPTPTTRSGTSIRWPGRSSSTSARPAPCSGPQLAWLDRFRWPLSRLAVLYLLFAAFIALSWHYNPLQELTPAWVARQIYPIDKTNIDILRFMHFLALAWLVRLLVPADAAFLRWPVFHPLRRCGEQSLLIFCIGTFLALSAQIVVSYFEESLLSQIVVSVAGIAHHVRGRLCGDLVQERRIGRSGRTPSAAEAVP